MHALNRNDRLAKIGLNVLKMSWPANLLINEIFFESTNLNNTISIAFMKQEQQSLMSA